jgi:hypothetical protein
VFVFMYIFSEGKRRKEEDGASTIIALKVVLL